MSRMIGQTEFFRPGDFDQIQENRTPGGKISGLKCPDCGAQAFKTDQTGIAVCGDYPGWYFKYAQKVERGKLKTKYLIEGDQMVEVPIYETETITEHP